MEQEHLELHLIVGDAIERADSRFLAPDNLPDADEMYERVKGIPKAALAKALYVLAHDYLEACSDQHNTVEDLVEWVETGRFNGKPLDLTSLRLELSL